MELKDNASTSGLKGMTFLGALQNSFSHLTGLHSIIIDRNGNSVEGDQKFGNNCYVKSRCNGTVPICDKTVESLYKREHTEGEIVFVECLLTGMGIWAVPIFIKDEYFGVWIIDYVRIVENDDYDYDRLYSKALDFGLSTDEAKEEIDKLYVISQKLFDNYIELIRILCGSFGIYAEASLSVEKSSMATDAITRIVLDFINSSDIGMLITDADKGTILLTNEKAAELAGKSVKDITGADCLLHFDPAGEGKCIFFPEQEGEQNGKFHVWEKYVSGYSKWLRLTYQNIKWLDGSDARMVSFTDISESKKLQMQLSQMAFYDYGTGLYNNAKFNYDFSDSCQLHDYGFVFFDIRELRKINDAYGRKIGDAVIIGLVEWIKGGEFEYESFYRIDGDSFCLSFKENRNKVEQAAESIYKRCESAWDLELSEESYHIFCNLTIGVIYGAEVSGDDSFINLIERTLEVARETRKPAVFNEKMNSEFKQHLMLEVSLKDCIKSGNMEGFMVYYQPIINPVNGMWVGVEALCRWNSPEFGMIGPDVFIKEAESMGLMNTVGHWVMETAVAQCKAWGLDKIPEFFLDVNVSALQMIDVNLDSRVDYLLEKYDYPGEKLSLELTESMEFHITESVISVINKLRAKGLQVAIDDFGTGYSSFNLLKSLPVTLLKTEKVFMENIEKDPYSQYMLYMMIELAHAADMKLIAEGVENEEQMRFLMRNGVDYMQGFLFSKPLSREDFEASLDNFVHSSINVAHVLYNEQEIKRLMKFEGSFSIAPVMYNAFNHCVQTLLHKNNLAEAIEEVMAYLGEQIGASSAQLFLDPAIYPENNKFLWCPTGTLIENVGYNDIVGSPKAAKWVEKLLRDGLIVESNTSFVSKDFPFDLEKHNIKSICVLPFAEDHHFFGFFSMALTHSYHNWAPDEIAIFYNIVSLIKSMLKKERLQKEVITHSLTMDTVLNSVDVGIYVSDLETDELLYINDVRRKILYDGDIDVKFTEGIECYKALYSRGVPCKQCTKARLKENNAPAQINSEYYDKSLDRYYKVSDSVVLWKGGKKAHIQYVVDITEVKDYQKKLRMYNLLDSKPRILERETLAYALVNAVKTSIEDELEFTTCALEIDYSKAGFDGDEKSVRERIREKTEELLLRSVRKDDVLGKANENTYVIGLLKCSEEVVIGKLERILSGLRKIFDTEENCIELNYSCAFSDELVKAISPDNILGIIDSSSLTKLNI